MTYYKHDMAIVDTNNIGERTRIWAFSHIQCDVIIGKDCNICEHTFIEKSVRIGNRVTIKSGVYLWEGIEIEDDVFIGPNATFTNDKYPRSKQYPDHYERTVIKSKASIGANATILPGITIGQNALIGAGTVVTKNVPPHAIVMGNPARIVGYVNAHEKIKVTYVKETGNIDNISSHLINDYGVQGVFLHKFPLIPDLRGSLTFSEFPKTLPFIPKRFFLVFDVPSKETRGAHAHIECEQFLVCVKGQCSVVVDDGKSRNEIILNKPNLGLYIPPMIWAIQYNYSKDAVLLVLASDIYKENDYIRDYDQFLVEVGLNNG